jgi:hypothetical protein
MTTFDLAEVRDFTADIDARMDRCDNGEEMECTTEDIALRRYAEFCCELRDGLRRWGQAVFSGRVAFDPEVERDLLDAARRLYSRALDAYTRGRQSEAPCYTLENLDTLAAALWDLDRLLKGWVTPQLAVGPAAKRWQYPDQAATEAERQRVASLPPLPDDWEPDDPRQRALYRKLRRS